VCQAFDKNHDGYIDEHELRQTMHELGMKLSAEDIKSMMSRAGCRITGRVYYEGSEFHRSGLVIRPFCRISHYQLLFAGDVLLSVSVSDFRSRDGMLRAEKHDL